MSRQNAIPYSAGVARPSGKFNSILATAVAVQTSPSAFLLSTLTDSDKLAFYEIDTVEEALQRGLRQSFPVVAGKGEAELCVLLLTLKPLLHSGDIPVRYTTSTVPNVKSAKGDLNLNFHTDQDIAADSIAQIALTAIQAIDDVRNLFDAILQSQNIAKQQLDLYYTLYSPVPIGGPSIGLAAMALANIFPSTAMLTGAAAVNGALTAVDMIPIKYSLAKRLGIPLIYVGDTVDAPLIKSVFGGLPFSLAYKVDSIPSILQAMSSTYILLIALPRVGAALRQKATGLGDISSLSPEDQEKMRRIDTLFAEGKMTGSEYAIQAAMIKTGLSDPAKLTEPGDLNKLLNQVVAQAKNLPKVKGPAVDNVGNFFRSAREKVINLTKNPGRNDHTTKLLPLIQATSRLATGIINEQLPSGEPLLDTAYSVILYFRSKLTKDQKEQVKKELLAMDNLEKTTYQGFGLGKRALATAIYNEALKAVKWSEGSVKNSTDSITGVKRKGRAEPTIALPPPPKRLAETKTTSSPQQQQAATTTALADLAKAGIDMNAIMQAIQKSSKDTQMTEASNVGKRRQETQTPEGMDPEDEPRELIIKPNEQEEEMPVESGVFVDSGGEGNASPEDRPPPPAGNSNRRGGGFTTRKRIES